MTTSPTTPDPVGGPDRRPGRLVGAARGGRSKLRRRVSGFLVLVMALVGAGFLAAVLTPTPQVAVAQTDPAQVRDGQQIYNNGCITCHGQNLQGVEGRGPSLIGVGEAAVYFQVSTGRMPAVRGEAQVERKPPKYDAAEVDALGAYIQANGGGPEVVRNPDGSIAQASLVGSDAARGGELYRLNCASCHNFTGRGGALASGQYAPTLDPANEQTILTAMLTGPQNMPKFSDRQLSPEEKADIIAYVKTATQSTDPGGYGLGGVGPVSEGLFIWIVGIVAVVGATLWIGARS